MNNSSGDAVLISPQLCHLHLNPGLRSHLNETSTSAQSLVLSHLEVNVCIAPISYLMTLEKLIFCKSYFSQKCGFEEPIAFGTCAVVLQNLASVHSVNMAKASNQSPGFSNPTLESFFSSILVSKPGEVWTDNKEKALGLALQGRLPDHPMWTIMLDMMSLEILRRVQYLLGKRFGI